MESESSRPPDGLLLLSYWYPPAIGAAAERADSFARYLPRNGWRVRVLTAAHGQATGGCQDVTVEAVVDRAAREGVLFADYDPRRRDEWWKAAGRLLVFPDRFRWWQRSALASALSSIARGGVDLLLASFPPASAARLALLVHRATGIPYVLDFRDRWIGAGGYEPAWRWIRRRHARLEAECVRSAAGIIAVSRPLADAIAGEHGLSPERAFVIPNGYEPEPALRSEPVAAVVDPLTIAHVGTVIARNRPESFLASLGVLARRGGLGDVRFRFVGNLSRDYVHSTGLDGTVTSTGLLPREQARREMEDASALLLLVGAYVGRWGHNAKLFEYVQTGRPILCVEECPGSHDRRLLEEFAGGRSFFAAMDDPRELGAAIEALRAYLRAHPRPALHLPPAFARYSRLNLAGELSAALRSILGRAVPPRVQRK
jgi:glycosyltransferase involved in cell wall biosynthesis